MAYNEIVNLATCYATLAATAKLEEELGFDATEAQELALQEAIQTIFAAQLSASCVWREWTEG